MILGKSNHPPFINEQKYLCIQAERTTEKNHADENVRLLQKINDMQTAFAEKLDEASKKAHHCEIEFSKLQAIANLSKEVQGSGQYTTPKPAKK